MNSTPAPNATEPHDALVARADERLAHAHDQIKRADEQLARLSDQLAKIERDAARPSSDVPGKRSPSGRPALGVIVGLSLAACIIVAAMVWQLPYGGGTRLVVALWAPQSASTPSLPPEDPPLPAQPAVSSIQVVAAEAVPPQAAPPQAAPPEAAPPQATLLAQTAPQDAAPKATAALPDQTQLLQTMARELANLERNIEQLKASQEEMKRVLATVSDQNLSRTSPIPTQAKPTLRKPERTRQSSRARSRPRYLREWMYDDW